MARRKTRNYFEPQRHPDHPRPVTRRQLIQQGFLTGGASIATGSIMSLFANPRAMAASHSRLSADLQAIIDAGRCPLIKTDVSNPLPFICIDLAGGANMAGSNVLGGRQEGQLDLLTTQGYSRMGLPGDMVPGTPETTPTLTSNGDHTDSSLGLNFHSDSAFLRQACWFRANALLRLGRIDESLDVLDDLASSLADAESLVFGTEAATLASEIRALLPGKHTSR